MSQVSEQPFAHQVGGHAASTSELKLAGDRVLKPFQSGRRGEREHAFYEKVFHDDQYLHFRPLLPSYFGLVPAGPEEDSSRQYLALEDLTRDRNHPCIMDVKVGTRSYEDGASLEKIEYERSKCPLQETVGFRLQGMKVFDSKAQNYFTKDKYFGRNISEAADLPKAFDVFFPSDTTLRRSLLLSFIDQLEAFAKVFDEQEDFQFIASSLLFIYSHDSNDTRPDIRLIDFAHVQEHPSGDRKKDDGVRKGLATILSILKQLEKDI